MEVYYWKPTIEEAQQFKTYDFNLGDMSDSIVSFYKKQVPDFCKLPTNNEDTIKKQIEWFEISNNEDLIILQNESEAFRLYNMKTEIEILKGINDIKSLKEKLQL